MLHPSTAATTGDHICCHIRSFPPPHSYGDQQEKYLFRPVTTSFVFVECLCRCNAKVNWLCLRDVRNIPPTIAFHVDTTTAEYPNRTSIVNTMSNAGSHVNQRSCNWGEPFDTMSPTQDEWLLRQYLLENRTKREELDTRIGELDDAMRFRAPVRVDSAFDVQELTPGAQARREALNAYLALQLDEYTRQSESAECPHLRCPTHHPDHQSEHSANRESSKPTSAGSTARDDGSTIRR